MTQTARYYVIEDDYVGPNRSDSHGNPIAPDSLFTIQAQPGRTNSSHEERAKGWLGTTNDNYQYAHGEFSTLEAARAYCDSIGYTVIPSSGDGPYDGNESDVVEYRTTPRAAADQVWAHDWAYGCTASDYGITADTTNERITEIAEQAQSLTLREQGWYVHDIGKMLTGWRDGLLNENN